MCDPLVGGLISGAVSLASGAMEASAQQNLMDEQNAANAQWVAYQTKIHQDQVNAENMERQQATNAQQATLQQVSPENQQKQQADEAARLTALYNNPSASTGRVTPTTAGGAAPSSLALSGEKTGNTMFGDSLTAAVNNATQNARGRIAALATAGSYGGSFGGLGTTVPIEFAQGGNQINLANAIRAGNLKTYGVEQQVQPLNYAAGPGMGQMGSIAKTLGGLAGTLTGTGLRGTGGWGGGGTNVSVSAPAPDMTDYGLGAGSAGLW